MDWLCGGRLEVVVSRTRLGWCFGRA